MSIWDDLTAGSGDAEALARERARHKAATDQGITDNAWHYLQRNPNEQHQPVDEINARAAWLPGRYGGSMQGTAAEIARTGAGYDRAAQLHNLGASDQEMMAEKGRGYTAQGLAQEAESARLRGAAAGNYGQQLDVRNNTNEALDRMRNFYKQGPTPSVAGAQMGQAAQASMGDRVAAAHGGPGGLRAAMNAPGLNGGQFAGMRAGEESAFRGARLGGMGAIQQGQTGVRSGDINAMNQNFGAANAYGQLGHDYAKTGVGTMNQGMETAGKYATLGEGAAQNAEQVRQNILLQQLSNDTSMMGAQTLADVAAAKAKQESDAATLGAIGTVGGGVVGTIVGGPVGGVAGAKLGHDAGTKASDIKAKKNIIPIPGQTAGSYGSGRGPMPPPMPMPIPAPPPMPMGSYGPGMGPPPPPPPGTVDLGNVDDWTGSDIRTKNRIIPMPQNYGVGY